MVIKINKPPQFKKKESFELIVSTEHQEEISTTWLKTKEKHPDIFDGEIFVVTNIFEENNEFILEISKSKYSTLVYARATNKINMHSLFSSAVLKTKDNYYVAVIDKNNQTNFLGGMASSEDFEGKLYNPLNCLKREVKEEINIDLDDKKIVSSLELKYFSKPNNMISTTSIGLVYLVTLSLTKQELEEYYNIHKLTCDHELQNLIFNNKTNYLKVTQNLPSTRTYILEVLKDLIEE